MAATTPGRDADTVSYPNQPPYLPPHDPRWQPPPPAQYPPPPYGYPPQPVGYVLPQQTQTVSTSGLPVWMHVCYATLGWIPCFLGWIIWPIHWWFAKSKTTTQMVTQVGQQPPPGRPPWGHV